MYKVIAATGIPVLNNTLAAQENIELRATCSFKSELEGKIQTAGADIIILTDKLAGDGSIVRMLIDLKRKYPHMRFIYFAGAPSNNGRIDALGTLVLAGIYDIDMSRTINIDLVMDLITNPKKEAAVDFLTKNILNDTSEIINAANGIEYQEFHEDEVTNKITLDNVFVFTSIKPGSGKSFCAVNAATGIAKYGKDNPKVALIEGDLQTLSIGTLLGVKEDDKHNMKAVMQAISRLYNGSEYIGTEEERKIVTRKIKNAFVKYKSLNNLDILVGSSITPDEIDELNVTPEYYSFLIDAIRADYDIIIVDTNSSIFHVSSVPLMMKAKYVYYVLNLDFNNVRNNIRYKKTIRELGIEDKARYILNENIENTYEFDEMGVSIEELNFTATDIEDKYFKLEAKIPVLPKTVFLNRLYNGVPVVLDSDGLGYTNHAKYELMKVSNEIWPMDESFARLGNKLSNVKQPNFIARVFGTKKKETVAKKKEEHTELDIMAKLDVNGDGDGIVMPKGEQT